MNQTENLTFHQGHLEGLIPDTSSHFFYYHNENYLILLLLPFIIIEFSKYMQI